MIFIVLKHVYQIIIYLINFVIDSFPPPQNVSMIVLDINPLKLIFEWSPVSLNCPALHYIISFDCGICPPVATNTTAVCTEIQLGISNCTFTIQTNVCDSLIGDATPISLMLKGMQQYSRLIIIRLGQTN